MLNAARRLQVTNLSLGFETLHNELYKTLDMH